MGYTKEQLEQINNEYAGKSLLDIIEAVQDLDEDGPFDLDLAEQIQNDMNDMDIGRAADDLDTPVYDHVDEIMRHLHYDNGAPLITDDYSYFDKYDRGQDYDSLFGSEEVESLSTDKNGKLIVVYGFTVDELRGWLKQSYDDASWEHDFGDALPTVHPLVK